MQEQLRQRKAEAERLRREEKQLRKEKLRAKEQSLLKQLEVSDEYKINALSTLPNKTTNELLRRLTINTSKKLPTCYQKIAAYRK